MSDVCYARCGSYLIDVSRTVLDRLHNVLVRNISFDILHDQLISAEAFDDITLADIKDEPKRSGKIRALLTELKQGDPENYNIFKESLEKTKQGHIVKQLVLEEKRVLQELKLEDCKRNISAKKDPKHLVGNPSNPQTIPRSPITQPESSVFGSPGNCMQDIHGKLGDED